MKKPKSISQKLKEHLASLSQEEFDKEWAEIEAMGFIGPTIEEFLTQPEFHKNKSESNNGENK